MDNFDWQFYIQSYSDLSNINNKNDAYKHYINHGKKEGRICSKEEYYTFDWKFYVELYNDLDYITDKNTAYNHYINHGKKEERLCNKETYNDFDWKFYVEMYDDLKYITNENMAFKHYINNGINEDRIYNKKKYINFDWNFYVDFYNDLKYITCENMALKHYINYGIKENRVYNSNNLCENFDWEFYITLYNDLKTKDEAYNHWIKNSSMKLDNNINKNESEETPIILEEKELTNADETPIILEGLTNADETPIISEEKELTNSDEIPIIFEELTNLDETPIILEEKESKNTYENLENSDNKNIPIEIEESCLITFIIPTIGRITLYRAINSLLNLKNKNWKAIIIFDGIKSNFKLNDKRISIIEIEKKGVLSENNSAGLVRNVGFDFISEDCEWIGFLDDDDYISEDYIENLKLEIELNNNIDVCIFRMIDSNNLIIPPKYNIGISKCNVGISFAFRKNIIKEVSFNNSKYEDYYFLKELEFKRYKIVISPYISYFIRGESFDCTELNKNLKRNLINF
jgi:hypothetical protein